MSEIVSSVVESKIVLLQSIALKPSKVIVHSMWNLPMLLWHFSRFYDECK